MSKRIKQMEMDALKLTFQDVRDLVLLNITGVSCQADNQMRQGLRRKNIRLQVVKNSLTKRVFDELGVQVTKAWEGPTTVAWGAGSLAELSKELDALARKNNKIQVKGAVSEGREIDFATALKMPTRAEAVGRVITLVTSPARRLVSQIAAPAARIAGQLKTLSERAPAAESPAAPAAEGAAAAPAG
jgi:large subunit ribosomal protein L10